MRTPLKAITKEFFFKNSWQRLIIDLHPSLSPFVAVVVVVAFVVAVVAVVVVVN